MTKSGEGEVAMPTYWGQLVTPKTTYSLPGDYDDELIIPIEKLREFAIEFPKSEGYEYLYAFAELARIAVTEKGWQTTPDEGIYHGFDGLHLACKYLKDKPEFTQEEQREVAAGLRNMGRFGHSVRVNNLDIYDEAMSRGRF
jgi:hypothetical protein